MRLKKYCTLDNARQLLKEGDYEMLDFDTAGDYEFTLEDEVLAYEEVKKLYAALDTLEPLEREVIERYYILDEPLGEIACDSDKSYYQFARVKKKALEKLKSLM